MLKNQRVNNENTDVIMSKKKLDTNGVPLVVETHPPKYTGYPFVTYLQFYESDALVIIDNIHKKHLQCYVMDLCLPAEVDRVELIKLAEEWYNTRSHSIPFSVFLNQHPNLNYSLVYRSYNIEYITRIVGPLFTYPISEVTVSRRKRRKPTVKTKVVNLT